MKPDNKAALEFLVHWTPEGPWVLTAIKPNREGITTRTFRPGQEKQLDKWLDEYNDKRNIYFNVNETIEDNPTKKANREDLKAVTWFHVDVDPRLQDRKDPTPKGEYLKAEQKRILDLFETNLPSGVPPPSTLIFSGGGYQGFWRLKDPIIINGDLDKAEDAKRYNQQLEVLFGADPCHNIDRIMRLPGTINIPDANKKKKGRRKALAKSLHLGDESYPTESFAQSPQVQNKHAGIGTETTHLTIGDIKRIEVEELDEWNVPNSLRVILVQGRDPDKPKEGDDSRSAWVFDAVCNLKRCDVPDEVVYSIITDPEFGISESVLEQKNTEKYALRQIERAKEQIVDPWLLKLNELFAVIENLGGKCRIIEEIWDHALKRPRLTRQSFEDFRNRYMNVEIEVGATQKGLPIMQAVGKWWLKHIKRRQYRTLVFAPGHEVEGAYNMWKGFAYESRPGDCSLFLGHIRENLCADSDLLYDYLMGWMARCVQEPDSPGNVAIVLRGDRGVGKSIYAKIFGALFGRHFLHISNPSHLVGNFNSHLRDTVVLFADEAFYAGDRKHVSILKTLITEETITIEAKGVDAETAPNYVHLIMASNDPHVIPAGSDERRFFVTDVGKAHKQDNVYFGDMLEQMEEGGYGALLHQLLTYDLSGYDVRKVPRTDALQEQKLFSLGPEEDWWYSKLENGRLLDNGTDWPEHIAKDELMKDFIEYSDRFKITRRGSSTSLGRFLHKVCPRLISYQRLGLVEQINKHGDIMRVKRRAYYYTLPNLIEARKNWDEIYGMGEWPPEVVQTDIEEETPEAF